MKVYVKKKTCISKWKHRDVLNYEDSFKYLIFLPLITKALYLIDTHLGTMAEAICDPRIIFRALFVMSFKR